MTNKQLHRLQFILLVLAIPSFMFITTPIPGVVIVCICTGIGMYRKIKFHIKDENG